MEISIQRATGPLTGCLLQLRGCSEERCNASPEKCKLAELQATAQLMLSVVLNMFGFGTGKKYAFPLRVGHMLKS